MIQTLIVDDEILVRRKLRRLLRDELEIEVVGEAASASEALQFAKSDSPQLVFLDLRLPRIAGIELIDALSADPEIAMPHIIFTTADDQYALRGFDVRAVDYLPKPFTPERLHTAVQRAMDRIRTTEKRTNRPHPQTISCEPYMARIVFKSRGRILFLPVADIRWIGAEENYVRICTDKETHLLRETMTAMEQKLDPRMFLRVHRSAIVNLQFVKEVRTESQGDYVVHLVNGHKLSMSRSYHSRLGSLLTRNAGRVA